MTPIQRLWIKIDKKIPDPDPSANGGLGSCWPWTAALTGRDMRPYVAWGGKRRIAYRIVCELFNGPPPSDKSLVRHKCDNKICCRPDHLQWGTHQENMNDMTIRERHGLTKHVVRNVRRLLSLEKDDGSKKHTQEEIAALYGISRESVSAIATRRVYREVEGGGDDTR